VYCGFGRTITPPWSMDGGEPGSVNYLEIMNADGKTLKLGRSPTRPVGKGDLVKIVTGGGGGWGTPSGRDPAAVVSDVQSGLISAEYARRVYGQQ
jgi:N-methylhydantoinase B